jgi:hypothetical protein
MHVRGDQLMELESLFESARHLEWPRLGIGPIDFTPSLDIDPIPHLVRGTIPE